MVTSGSSRKDDAGIGSFLKHIYADVTHLTVQLAVVERCDRLIVNSQGDGAEVEGSGSNPLGIPFSQRRDQRYGDLQG